MKSSSIKPPAKPITCTYLIVPIRPASWTSPLVCGRPAETFGDSPRCHRHTPERLKAVRERKHKAYLKGKTRFSKPTFYYPLPPPDVDVASTTLI